MKLNNNSLVNIVTSNSTAAVVAHSLMEFTDAKGLTLNLVLHKMDKTWSLTDPVTGRAISMNAKSQAACIKKVTDKLSTIDYATAIAQATTIDGNTEYRNAFQQALATVMTARTNVPAPTVPPMPAGVPDHDDTPNTTDCPLDPKVYLGIMYAIKRGEKSVWVNTYTERKWLVAHLIERKATTNPNQQFVSVNIRKFRFWHNPEAGTILRSQKTQSDMLQITPEVYNQLKAAGVQDITPAREVVA